MIFFVSIPFSFFSYELFASINYSFLPSFLSHWIQSYLSDEMYAKLILNKGRSGFFWVTQLFSYISYLAYFLIPIMMMKYKEQILENSEIGKLYPFYILLFSITNFIRMLPTIGVRYFLTIQIMSVYMFFKVFYPMKKTIFGYYCLLGLFRSSYDGFIVVQVFILFLKTYTLIICFL